MPAPPGGGGGGLRRDRDLTVYIVLMAVSVIFSSRAGSRQSTTVSMVFLAFTAALAALAAHSPRFYARHRARLAVAFRLLYAASANLAVAGSARKQLIALPSAPRFWAERSNPYVLLLLGLTAGLEPGPLAALATVQMALLGVSLPPACAALEARHPSYPGRFADAARAWTGLVGGLVATMVGDAATLVDLASGRRSGGGSGGGGRAPTATPCPVRTCCLVMAQLYLTASIVSLAAAMAGSRRRRAAAAAAASTQPPPSAWVWALDRHARAAILEAGGAMLGTWVLLTAVDGWLPCPT